MLKYILLITMVSTSVLSTQEKTTPLFPFEFGISQDDIKNIMDTEPIEEDSASGSLIYTGKILDRSCKIAFLFLENKLFMAAYQFDGYSAALDDAKLEYNKINTTFTELYGTEFEEVEEWEEPELEGTMTNEEAIRDGGLTIQAIWQKDNLLIINSIAGDNGEIANGVLFMSLDFIQIQFAPEAEEGT